MPIRLAVRAEVIDLKTDQPTSADSFLVDTNVWLWMAYPSISQVHPNHLNYQLTDYPSYLQKAGSGKSRRFRCGFSLAEMAHQIEQTERAIYNTCNSPEIPTKEYRHNLPGERSRIAGEIRRAWEQVKSFSEPLELLIDDSTTDIALGNLGQWPLDGYDVFFVEAMKKNGIRQIITDDGDFATVPDIRVFTANQNVISAARNQGKIVSR